MQYGIVKQRTSLLLQMISVPLPSTRLLENCDIFMEHKREEIRTVLHCVVYNSCAQ